MEVLTLINADEQCYISDKLKKATTHHHNPLIKYATTKQNASTNGLKMKIIYVANEMWLIVSFQSLNPCVQV